MADCTLCGSCSHWRGENENMGSELWNRYLRMNQVGSGVFWGMIMVRAEKGQMSWKNRQTKPNQPNISPYPNQNTATRKKKYTEKKANLKTKIYFLRWMCYLLIYCYSKPCHWQWCNENFADYCKKCKYCQEPALFTMYWSYFLLSAYFVTKHCVQLCKILLQCLTVPVNFQGTEHHFSSVSSWFDTTEGMSLHLQWVTGISLSLV